MNYWMRIGAIFGVVTALFEVLFMYDQYSGFALLPEDIFFSTALAGAYSIAYVVYWYGLSCLGRKYGNPSLHNAAIAFIATSIGIDLLTNIPLIYPAVVAWGSYDIAFLFLSTITAIAAILVGIAVQRLRPQFGQVAHWYGIGAMLSGVIGLIGDLGFAAIIAFVMILNIALYLLGGLILMRASK